MDSSEVQREAGIQGRPGRERFPEFLAVPMMPGVYESMHIGADRLGVRDGKVEVKEFLVSYPRSQAGGDNGVFVILE